MTAWSFNKEGLSHKVSFSRDLNTAISVSRSLPIVLQTFLSFCFILCCLVFEAVSPVLCAWVRSVTQKRDVRRVNVKSSQLGECFQRDSPGVVKWHSSAWNLFVLRASQPRFDHVSRIQTRDDVIMSLSKN